MLLIRKLAVHVESAVGDPAVQVTLFIKVSVAEHDEGRPRRYPIFPNNAPSLCSEPVIHSLSLEKPLADEDPVYKAYLMLDLPIINLNHSHERSNRIPHPSLDINEQQNSITLVLPSQRSPSLSNPNSTRKHHVKTGTINKGRRSLDGTIPSPRAPESSDDKLDYVICLSYVIRLEGDVADDVVASIPLPRCLQNRLIFDLETFASEDRSSVKAAIEGRIVTSPKVSWSLESSQRGQVHRLRLNGRSFSREGTFPSTSVLEIRWKDASLSSLDLSSRIAPLSSSELVQIFKCHTDATLVFQHQPAEESSSLIMESLSKLETNGFGKRIMLSMKVPGGFELEALHVKQCSVDPSTGLEITHDVKVERMPLPRSDHHGHRARAATPVRTRPVSPSSPTTVRRLSHGRSKSTVTTGAQASLLRLQMPLVESSNCSFEASNSMESLNDLVVFGNALDENPGEDTVEIVHKPTTTTPVKAQIDSSGEASFAVTPRGDRSLCDLQFILDCPLKTDVTPVILIMQTVFSMVQEPSAIAFRSFTTQVPAYHFPSTPAHDFDLVIGRSTPSAAGDDGLWMIDLVQPELVRPSLPHASHAPADSLQDCHIAMTSTADIPLFTLHQRSQTSKQSTQERGCRPGVGIEVRFDDRKAEAERDGKATLGQDIFGSEPLRAPPTIPETWSRQRGGSGICEKRPMQELQEASYTGFLAKDNLITSPDMQSSRMPDIDLVSTECLTSASSSPQLHCKSWILGFLCGIFAVLSIQSSYQQAERLRGITGDSTWPHVWENLAAWTATSVEGTVSRTSTSMSEIESASTESSPSRDMIDMKDGLLIDDPPNPSTASSASIYAAFATVTTTYVVPTVSFNNIIIYHSWSNLSLGLARLFQNLLSFNPFYWVFSKDPPPTPESSDNDPHDNTLFSP